MCLSLLLATEFPLSMTVIRHVFSDPQNVCDWLIHYNGIMLDIFKLSSGL
jgi:hypothetical protein